MATMTLEALVAQLQRAYGDALRSVVLYGSAAAGELLPKRSDLNVLVLVSALDAERLNAASAVSRAWSDAGNQAPLTLTEREWRSSADIFPMEYADILERHKVLFGTLPSEGMGVSPADLRWQLENQAMGKLLHLRQGVLASGGEARRQLALLEGSLSTYMVLFRAAQRLVGEHPPTDYEALTRAVAARAGFDAEPFARVVRHVRGTARLAAADAPSVLAGYVDGATRFAAYVDQLRPS